MPYSRPSKSFPSESSCCPLTDYSVKLGRVLRQRQHSRFWTILGGIQRICALVLGSCVSHLGLPQRQDLPSLWYNHWGALLRELSAGGGKANCGPENRKSNACLIRSPGLASHPAEVLEAQPWTSQLTFGSLSCLYSGHASYTNLL